MAGSASAFREELVQLGEALFEGHTNYQDYERKLRRLQSRYNLNQRWTSGDDAIEQIEERGFDFQFDETSQIQDGQLHPSFLDPDSHDAIQKSAHETIASAPTYISEKISAQGNPQVSKSQDAVASAVAFVKEWTPFALVALYFVFSTCLYMICDGELISIFWFIYLSTNFYIAGSTVIEAIMSISPCRDARRAVRRIQENDWTFPTPDQLLPILDLVTVAYLPNEKDIILDRIKYAVDEIIYPRDRIRINIVYNTPVEIEPLETNMKKLEEEHSQLRIIKVQGSKSKADNLNHFFTLNTGSDVIAVFDCDHYPHPCGPRWAAERFMSDRTIDIVQGRCVIFNSNASFLSAMIAVEFDKIYAVSHPGRAATWGFGLFTGSNGYWRTTLLRELRMNGDMLTEDIDSSLRAVSKGANTVHDLNVVSYELAPTTFKSFWNQRLRWAQGWAQASLKHIILTVNKPAQGKRTTVQRFGLVSLLFIRELSYYLVTQYCCLVAGILILDFPRHPSQVLHVLFFQYPVAYWLFIISAICLIGTLVITNRAKSEFVRPWMIVAFSIFYPAYLVLTATIGLYGHARQVSKYSSWNPTART